MWLAGFKARPAAEIYLSSSGICLRGFAGAPSHIAAENPKSALDSLAIALNAGVRQPRIDCWLSGGLARPFTVEAVAGVRNAAEALQLARATAADASGLDEPCRVWIDRWAEGQPCLAVAVSEELLVDIERWAKAAQCKLRGIAPWWMNPLNAALVRRPIPSLVAVVEDDAFLAFSGIDGDRASCVGGYWPPPAATQRIEALKRLALAQGTAAQAVKLATFRDDDSLLDNGSTLASAISWSGSVE